MTLPGIEPRSPGPLVNTLLIRPMNQAIGLMSRVFTNGRGDLGSIPGHIIPKNLKMVLDTSLLNTQQYKIHIKGKVKQSLERSSPLPYTLAIENGAFWSPSITVANFTYLFGIKNIS